MASYSVSAVFFEVYKSEEIKKSWSHKIAIAFLWSYTTEFEVAVREVSRTCSVNTEYVE